MPIIVKRKGHKELKWKEVQELEAENKKPHHSKPWGFIPDKQLKRISWGEEILIFFLKAQTFTLQPQKRIFIYPFLFLFLMHIGGQAVVEGVMMRNKERFAVAVRLPNGKIRLRREKNSRFPKLFNVFFLRGIVGLGYMLKDGMKSLIWSSNQQLGKSEKLTAKELAVAIGGSFLFAIVLFIGLPFFAAGFFAADGIWFNLLDGAFRAAVFLGYLAVISRMKDVQRLFQYHGAEHKTIYCYEAQKEAKNEKGSGTWNMSIGAIRKFPRQHHRCGTSFLVLVILISIVLFSFLTGPWWAKLAGRLLLLPVVAGIGSELIKLGERFRDKAIVKPLLLPGLWLQEITTKDPTDKQIEVAMKALEGVVGK